MVDTCLHFLNNAFWQIKNFVLRFLARQLEKRKHLLQTVIFRIHVQNLFEGYLSKIRHFATE